MDRPKRSKRKLPSRFRDSVSPVPEIKKKKKNSKKPNKSLKRNKPRGRPQRRMRDTSDDEDPAFDEYDQLDENNDNDDNRFGEHEDVEIDHNVDDEIDEDEGNYDEDVPNQVPRDVSRTGSFRLKIKEIYDMMKCQEVSEMITVSFNTTYIGVCDGAWNEVNFRRISLELNGIDVAKRSSMKPFFAWKCLNGKYAVMSDPERYSALRECSVKLQIQLNLNLFIIGESTVVDLNEDDFRTVSFMLPMYTSATDEKTPPHVIVELYALLCAVKRISRYSERHNRYMIEEIKDQDIMAAFRNESCSISDSHWYMKIGGRSKKNILLNKAIRMEKAGVAEILLAIYKWHPSPQDIKRTQLYRNIEFLYKERNSDKKVGIEIMQVYLEKLKANVPDGEFPELMEESISTGNKVTISKAEKKMESLEKMVEDLKIQFPDKVETIEKLLGDVSEMKESVISLFGDDD